MSQTSRSAATARAARPWATATMTLAIIATPLGGLLPRGAEAFVLSAIPSTHLGATGSAAGRDSGFPRNSAVAALPSSVRRSRGFHASVANCWAEAHTPGVWGARLSSRRGRRRAGSGGRNSYLGSPRMSTPGSDGADGLGGMREDEKFPDKIPSFSTDGAAQQSIKSGGAGEEEVEEDDGSWSDAEVERRVAERKNTKVDPYAVDDDEEEDDPGEEYLEIVANMTKPLGITIEASTDKDELIYLTSAGEQAEACGLQVGDVLTGVSGVYGNDVWSVKGKSIEKVRSLVRCRSEPFILVRVERGHDSLEERCAEGYGITSEEDCWRLTDEGECEVDYTDLWTSVYQEENDVLSGGAAVAAAGGAAAGEPKRTNVAPPQRDAGFGSPLTDETWTSDF